MKRFHRLRARPEKREDLVRRRDGLTGCVELSELERAFQTVAARTRDPEAAAVG